MKNVYLSFYAGHIYVRVADLSENYSRLWLSHSVECVVRIIVLNQFGMCRP